MANIGNADQMQAQFYKDDGTYGPLIDKWTRYSIHSDFFVPADTFHLELEDDRAPELIKNIQIGMQVIISINQTSILVGYIDSCDLNYIVDGGKKLTIKGRDILGMIADTYIYPNKATDPNKVFQFSSSTTLKQALETIFKQFSDKISGITIDPQVHADQMTFATGFKTGVRIKGKTGRQLSKSYQSALAHLVKPSKHEGALEYALRICKHAGLNIKMIPGTHMIWAGPPTYDRQGGSPYQLFSIAGDKRTNIKQGQMEVNWSKQPSVIIGEATGGNLGYRKQSQKVVCINEFTGYVRGQPMTLDNATEGVKNAIKNLTSGTVSTNANAANRLIPANNDLLSSLPQSIVGLQSSTARPMYWPDEQAHNGDECQFGVDRLMSDHQDKFFKLKYKVFNHTNNKAIWQPDWLVKVIDNVNGANGNYWLRSRTFTKSDTSGTETMLELSLAGIYGYYITE